MRLCRSSAALCGCPPGSIVVRPQPRRSYAITRYPADVNTGYCFSQFRTLPVAACSKTTGTPEPPVSLNQMRAPGTSAYVSRAGAPCKAAKTANASIATRPTFILFSWSVESSHDANGFGWKSCHHHRRIGRDRRRDCATVCGRRREARPALPQQSVEREGACAKVEAGGVH